jgi:hypothetical protein
MNLLASDPLLLDVGITMIKTFYLGYQNVPIIISVANDVNAGRAAS